MRPSALTKIAVAVSFGAALAACSGSRPTTATGAAPAAPTVAAAPDWPAPTDPSGAVKAAGLPMLGEEKLTVHYHAHLDVVVDGQPVPVPADLGVDDAKHLIAPLHTHDATGVVHIESATDVPFTLGQLFAEWGRPISATRIGDYTVPSGRQLRVYRNGQQVTGDPAKVVFRAHDEIVVRVGPAGEPYTPPSAFAFPPGL